MHIRTICALALILCLPCLTRAQTIISGTFNLRYDNPGDTGNLWKDRAPVVASLIRFHDFDVLGTQEGLKNQIDDIQAALPEYAHYGKGRDDGKDGGEHSAIFYRKDRFRLLNKGDFWLSETPDKPGLGWDATCCNRICSWVYLQDFKSKKKFYFFNAHFDHQGVKARVESGKLIIKKVREIAGKTPAIFTGDLNGGHNSDWYQTIKTSGVLFDTYYQVQHPYVSNASFNAFGSERALASDEIIDHIFATRQFKAIKWGILTDTYRGKFPSDHFPVISVLKF